MLLMVDNYDSFTYNIVQYFGELNQEVKVVRNDQVTLEDIESWQPKYLVIGPGAAGVTPSETRNEVKSAAYYCPCTGDIRPVLICPWLFSNIETSSAKTSRHNNCNKPNTNNSQLLCNGQMLCKVGSKFSKLINRLKLIPYVKSRLSSIFHSLFGSLCCYISWLAATHTVTELRPDVKLCYFVA